MPVFFCTVGWICVLEGLVARIDKLELEVDALLNDEIPGADGANCPSPRSLRVFGETLGSLKLHQSKTPMNGKA